MSHGIDDTRFMKGFLRLCKDGVRQGWHERNGGNVTYRMSEADVADARSYFLDSPGPWQSLEVAVPNLGGECFLTTGTGHYLRNAWHHPERELGIVEVAEGGGAWRLVWGFTEGGAPTSELPSHLLNHAVRKEATGGANRVIYHAHPANVIAMSFVVPLDSKEFTVRLWRAMTECVLVFPEGVGVVPWMVPGGFEIARASAELFKTFPCAVWAQHGLFASGATFDEAYGLMHTVDKAADVYRRARTMNGGSEEFLNTITDDGLRAIAREFHITMNEAFLG